MNYKLGVQMVEDKPVVVMEEMDETGALTGEVTKGKSLSVAGRLHSDAGNQLVLTTTEKAAKEKEEDEIKE